MRQLSAERIYYHDERRSHYNRKRRHRRGTGRARRAGEDLLEEGATQMKGAQRATDRVCVPTDRLWADVHFEGAEKGLIATTSSALRRSRGSPEVGAIDVAAHTGDSRCRLNHLLYAAATIR